MTAKLTFQVVRVAALLAVIFAAGIVIGRHTSPEPAPVIIQPAPRAASVDNAVRIMSRNFKFDAEKEALFRSLMDRMEQEMRPFDPGTAERRDVWRRFLPEIRSFVPDELMDRFEAQKRRTEQRFERTIEQRERASGGNQ